MREFFISVFGAIGGAFLMWLVQRFSKRSEVEIDRAESRRRKRDEVYSEILSEMTRLYELVLDAPWLDSIKDPEAVRFRKFLRARSQHISTDDMDKYFDFGEKLTLVEVNLNLYLSFPKSSEEEIRKITAGPNKELKSEMNRIHAEMTERLRNRLDS